MKEAVILAGGLGTRLSEETGLRPKPMVEIGGFPILLHIMRYMSRFGINTFTICLGYKGNMVKDYFTSLMTSSGSIRLNFRERKTYCLEDDCSFRDWNIKLIETGALNMTGSRLKQALKHVESTEFLFTYGDGLTNQDINALEDSHRMAGKIATVTAVKPPGRFGALNLDLNSSDYRTSDVKDFSEKPLGDNAWINAGYFVLSKEVSKYLSDDQNCTFEKEPLTNLARDNQLNAFKHEGFWKPMDTLKDKNELNDLIKNCQAPWMEFNQ